jgi:hypothetical protein
VGLAILLMWVFVIAYCAVRLAQLHRARPKKPKPRTLSSVMREMVEEADRHDAELERQEEAFEELRVAQTLLEYGVDPAAIITAEDVALPKSDPGPETGPEEPVETSPLPIVLVDHEAPEAKEPVPHCRHGARVLNSGTTNWGRRWRALFCAAPIPPHGQCPPIWLTPLPEGDSEVEVSIVKCRGVYVEEVTTEGVVTRESLQHKSCKFHYPDPRKAVVKYEGGAP